jgi:hypothetical protein
MNDKRICTLFGAQSTAAEVIAGVDLSGKRGIVTGGSSGIGVDAIIELSLEATRARGSPGPLKVL